MISFSGKTVLITGATGGIGQATAKLMATYGANVALCGRNRETLEAVRDTLIGCSGHVTCHVSDIGDASSCSETVRAVAEQHGRIDHLVHAAAYYPKGSVEKMTDADWHNLMRVNLDGTFFMCRTVIPYLGEDSSIVTIASLAAHRGSHSRAHYAASKGAVISLSKSLALELAPKTRVNVLTPGIIETSMSAELRQEKDQAFLNDTPLKRFGTAEDVAGGIAFLCSSLARFVTGETLHVNGGLYIS